jgi:hypothetical protein
MPTDELPSPPDANTGKNDAPADKRPLTPAAERALAEAAARRAERDLKASLRIFSSLAQAVPGWSGKLIAF